MMRKVSVWFTTAALTLGLCSAAMAAVPSVIPYQGRLTDAAGTPISGNQSIVFSLFTTLTGGVAVHTETQATVAVANGLFSVDISPPASVFTGGPLFLEIKVGADPAMVPRQPLGSVAYAQRAGTADAIPDGSVTTLKLADASATTAKLADGSVTTIKIPDASVTKPKLAPGLVPAMANASVGFIGGVVGLSNLTSVAVTFPAAGFAVVIGTIESSVSVPPGGTNCYGLEISDVSGASQGIEAFQCVHNTNAGVTKFYEGNAFTTRVFSVAAGAKSFFLIGNQQSGSWSLFIRKLTVMYFPDAIGPTSLVTEPQPGPSTAHRVGNTIQ